MALKARKKKVAKKKKTANKPDSPDPPSDDGEFEIPGALRKPKRGLDRTCILLYGPPKVGKTTVASKFPGAWFVATEQGQDFVPTRKPTVITSWATFCEWGAFMSDTKPTHFTDGTKIETIVIDTVSLLYRMCFVDVCNSLNVEDPGEMTHGKGWSRLTNEFERVMNTIRSFPFTLVLLAHARQKEFKAKGRTRDRWEMDLGAAAYRWCNAAADLIARMFVDTVVDTKDGKDGEKVVTGTHEERIMQMHPSSDAVAGGRMTDLYPEFINMDYNELVGYADGTFLLEE